MVVFKQPFLLFSLLITVSCIMLFFTSTCVLKERECKTDVTHTTKAIAKETDSDNLFCICYNDIVQKLRINELEVTLMKRNARNHFVSDLIETGYVMSSLFDPYVAEANCYSLERFGSWNIPITNDNTNNINKRMRYASYPDGGKYVCGVDMLKSLRNKNIIKNKDNNNDSDNHCLVYSIGSNNEIEFEASVKEIIGNHCEIHTFDPTLTEPFIGTEYSIFHDWGLGRNNQIQTVKDSSFISYSLSTIVKKLNHTDRTIDMLKIDCEGCEWVVFDEIFHAIANRTLLVNQIFVELHNYEGLNINIKNLDNFFTGADMANMNIVSKECNIYTTHCETVEYTLVSTDFLHRANAYTICNFGGNQQYDC